MCLTNPNIKLWIIKESMLSINSVIKISLLIQVLFTDNKDTNPHNLMNYFLHIIFFIYKKIRKLTKNYLPETVNGVYSQNHLSKNAGGWVVVHISLNNQRFPHKKRHLNVNTGVFVTLF